MARQGLRQPGPGLVGDRAGLVALGAVEAVVWVWMWGVGHDGHPGSRSGRAARPAPRSGGTSRRRPGRPHVVPPAGSSRPAGDVTSRWISPTIYGERCNAVAEGRLASEADCDERPRQSCLKRRGGHPKFCGRAPCVFGRGDQGTMATSGVARRASESASAPPGAARMLRPAGLLGWCRVGRSRRMPRWAACPRCAQAAVRCGRHGKSGQGTVALSDHLVRLPPRRRPKTTDHGHGRVGRPCSALFHEGEPPPCWSPRHIPAQCNSAGWPSFCSGSTQRNSAGQRDRSPQPPDRVGRRGGACRSLERSATPASSRPARLPRPALDGVAAPIRINLLQARRSSRE